MKKGRLFVISGTSGVGKSTVLQEVMNQMPDLRFSVSATTRDPRPGEAEGVNYYYVSMERFQEMIQEKAFLEYDAHMGHYYGTPVDQLEDKLSRGNVALDIEPNGAFRVREKRPDATLIFIAPPSWDELVRRLTGRGDTSPEQIKLRLERAAWELEQSKEYDHVVVNDLVETCAEKIINIITETCGEE